MKIQLNKNTYLNFLKKYKEVTDEIIGQDSVLEQASTKIYTSLMQMIIWLKEKPTVLFLAWPSRVWKTFFAKKISLLFWGSYLYIPMSNYFWTGAITSLTSICLIWRK